ncbi:FAD-dependent oxidoreductase [Ochrobactrum sp. CM-21-5]|nr:FAD-dependent oxidoreductase [Ochrobactrum sp. CM-21-5]MBC2886293.1 FAD-dependent oxidoreductase [Ochrobactrum sp. CM-21-5]
MEPVNPTSETPAPELLNIMFQFNGRPIKARAGDTIAAALMAHGLNIQGAAKNGDKRGLFCGMGVCHDCLVTIDDRTAVRSCMTKAMPGMKVEANRARRAIFDADTVETPLPEIPSGPLPEDKIDVLVVGAGPAGLKAAITARKAGVDVMVVDERPSSGGQFYKQPAHECAEPAGGVDAQSRDGARLISEAHAADISVYQETLVWGAFREDERLVIGVIRKGEARYVLPRILIIATGAFEQPAVFPGWTLPGVLTTGACQTLIRSYGVVPGQKIVVVGNGPLNFQVAIELAQAGANVDAVVEMAPAPWHRPARGIKLFRANPILALQGMGQLSMLKRLGIPVLWKHRLVEVAGENRAEQAVFADAKGHRRTFSIDAVAVTQDFAPSNELSRLLGCAHREPQNGFSRLEVVRNDFGATSLDDVFVVGEAGGFGGAHIAMAQGELAGAEAAARLGHPLKENREALRRLQRNRKFQQALWSIFEAEKQDVSRLDDSALVCRCEAITLGQLRETISNEGVTDLPTLKRLTRAGMGRCQGRYCIPRLAELVPRPDREEKFPAPQMPLRPIPLAALAVEKPEWGGHKRALLPPSDDMPFLEPIDRREADIVVVGAGIVGLCTALFLARNGADVIVLDRGYPNARASGGNAGSLHAQLLSFDHGSKAENGGSPAAMTLPLQRDSINLWKEIECELGKDCEIKITGGLMVAETEKELKFLAAKTAVERRFGVECNVIDASELRRLEPALQEGLIGAAYCPQEGKINPLVATQVVLDGALAAGARVFSRTNVIGIHPEKGHFRIETDRGVIRAGRIVNAAGAFASEIGSMVGRTVPVFGAPLQMIVTEAVAPTISRLIAHADRHLTLKQAANGNFLIGGGWTAGLDPVHRHPRPLRSSLEGNIWVAQRVVPSLRKLNIIRSWAAMNINIDGAPLIGEDPAVPGFYNAVTSNGYTLAPLVGRLTADLVLHGETDRDVGAFSITRFST